MRTKPLKVVAGALSINSGRDEWSINHSRDQLGHRIQYLIKHYMDLRSQVGRHLPDRELDVALGAGIKWTLELKRLFKLGRPVEYMPSRMVEMQYRPFAGRYYYFDPLLTKRVFRIPDCMPTGREVNYFVCLPAKGSTPRVTFSAFAVKEMPDLNFFTPDPSHGLPRYRYSASGERLDNIADWALNQFASHYDPAVAITKDDLFHYTYAVLHDPIYRETYALNLRREFPRIPFYPDFPRWAAWGKLLMDLHIGYETVEPWPLKRIDTPDVKAGAAGLPPMPALKADQTAGTITLDSETSLSGFPVSAWTYRLGNRSGLEWVLDQYKEKTPKDLTIREKFNTYHFADYKEHVADLLARVTRVSVETMAVVDAMKSAKR